RDWSMTGVQTCALQILIAVGGDDVAQAGIDPGGDLAGGQHGLGGRGGGARRRCVHAADQPARRGARRERNHTGHDQPALVVPSRRRRRLAGEPRAAHIALSAPVSGTSTSTISSTAGIARPRAISRPTGVAGPAAVAGSGALTGAAPVAGSSAVGPALPVLRSAGVL